MNFNEYQIQAIEHNKGPLAVMAVPGSGKSRVLVQRVVNLVRKYNVTPQEIYCCTFTKKATQELVDRITKQIGEAGKNVNIKTIHGLCYSILLSFYSKYRKPKPDLISNYAIYGFLDTLIRSNETKLKKKSDVIAQINLLKMQAITPSAYYDSLPDDLKENQTIFNIRNSEELALHFIYASYQAFLRSKNMIDYSDMVFLTYQVLHSPNFVDFTNEVKNKYKYILVDEFQDTSDISYKILKLLAENTSNMFVVGDIRQSIFKFIGANVDIFDQFIKEFNSEVITLPLNYRSTPEIVGVANKLMSCSAMENLSDIIPFTKDNGIVTHSTYFVPEDEALSITSKILELVNDGVDYNDIAILYRVHSQATHYVDIFTKQQIPYKIFSDYNPFKRKEIRILMAYLKVIAASTPPNMEEYFEAAKHPVRYIKKDSMSSIDDAYQLGSYDSLWDALINCEDILRNEHQIKSINNFVNDIRRAKRYYATIQDKEDKNKLLIDYLLDAIGLQKVFTSSDFADSDLDSTQGADRELDIDFFIDLVNKYKTVDDLMLFQQSLVKNKKDLSKTKGVSLMTMHSSKGLEFPVVFVISISTRIMPFYLAEQEGNTEEERRLFYVAMTRAEKQLHLSSISGHIGRFKVEPSYFLNESGIEVKKIANTFIN